MESVAVEPIIVLHLGCQHKKTPEALGLVARDANGGTIQRPIQMINLDMNPHVEPDILCTLGKEPIPLEDNSIDLVIANHVLEHIGDHAGDVTAWFHFWSEVYRVMRPGGALKFECPYYSSLWAWADPTHVRAISEMTFLYLNQDAYRSPGSSIPDYRPNFDFWSFDPRTGRQGELEIIPDHTNEGVRQKEAVSFIRGTLVARKPLRPYWEDAQ